MYDEVVMRFTALNATPIGRVVSHGPFHVVCVIQFVHVIRFDLVKNEFIAVIVLFHYLCHVR